MFFDFFFLLPFNAFRCIVLKNAYKVIFFWKKTRQHVSNVIFLFLKNTIGFEKNMELVKI